MRPAPESKDCRTAHTTAMCDNPPLPNLLKSNLFVQSTQCMEGASSFERPDLLVILAFEEQSYLRFRRRLSLIFCSFQSFGCLWC